jgi:hypothetical protein
MSLQCAIPQHGVKLSLQPLQQTAGNDTDHIVIARQVVVMSNFLIMKTKLFSIKIKFIEHSSSSRHSSIAIEDFLKSKQILPTIKAKT